MRELIKRTAIPHQVVRHDINVRDTYDGFSHRFEAAVPLLNRDRCVSPPTRDEQRNTWPQV